MPFLFFAAIALIGAAIHRHRDSQPRSTTRTLEIFLVWWMVVAVGIAAIFGAMFHFFDGPTTAREIGFTNGDGGFQTEVGVADLVLWSDFIAPLAAIALYLLLQRARRNAAPPGTLLE
jgi:heme A synthase